jgi:16S rRNA (adenine1518-N6/adenine1519-N6)-dimethyltransferase
MNEERKRLKDKELENNERFQHKKSLGQNFLTSDVVPRWLTEAGEVAAGDTILEIGPGTGALTKCLLATGATVIAIEADIRAVDILETTFASEIATGKLKLHHLDARTLDISALGLTHHGFKVVANIPYYLSGFLLRVLLEGTTQPTTLVFLMQKEVVTRIAREVKESILSLSVKAFGIPKYIKTVTRGHFNPPPKVDSAILQITNISRNNFTDADELPIFFNLLHLGFGQKRKQLLSNFTHLYSRDALTDIFITLAIPLDARAETIRLETWLLLTRTLKTVPTISTPLSD